MNSEAISTLLFEASTLLVIGMTFVFLFLTLLIAAINLIAAFCRKFPGHFHTDPKTTLPQAPLPNTDDQPDAKTMAVIGAAVHQYRKKHRLNVKD
ncbi:OadG family protein [Alteromonas sp. ASW11-130]|uniref:OadG family protein n=1 Tax=Alteromonas sp. ASW11-130 TaxID=3015775 RepID=UPI0022427D4A|nr:OadG family transporter subunit [Alteromonas sp. ASW11-130]MCW8092864.1 OadG family transporter subunit [Alteromonas sp. ASW11-130]